MVVFNSCINENKIFDRETMPSKNEFKFFVTNVLKGLSAEPSSVDVDFVGVILWHKDYGWVAQCNFSWVNMRGQRERQFLHFAIKGNAQYGVKILTEDQVEVIKHLPMNMIKNEYEVN
jgi:hypothetical protein